ncbi:type II toxin-antitoxin system RelE/ParE family toxin [Vibrio parahaemolyticus]|uniref:type II toxin-antitoxin system RelE/ParE family toxin n=1 Tax=Vibrio parahaemolyticus TaxID=670 RepID=UPI00111E3667|nr:type II toxin-antitoxin system RelE/ParE family toxin [Vibrio parahaemolyticus]EHH1048574.1 type II toxin-antitoxin system RelE/ParE family toxin [Vibrio parahaemolyticus]MBE3752266.1 type II toxin-antitoxin system RelE/ParE family toxin [Vibrio parahaemolyticus]MBE3762169.1 type II toxin-antitoxin system RelE/ParE family toxin [Vibrio parahaemolyticus]TOA87670.1 addiction module toxin RelE [Vibrio parahaemolyticus]TOG01506.1 addiction module toxin RelE [Vibrio parahaemolyticus]
MSDEQNGNKINVFESRSFEKHMNKLSEAQCEVVEDEIDKIIENPELGTRKKGDLSHLWVHKFKMDNQEVLLGYSWVEGKLELYLLNIGPHENFYTALKKRRKADLKIIG